MAAAPQGPGFWSAEPSVNAMNALCGIFDIYSSAADLDLAAWSLSLDPADPRPRTHSSQLATESLSLSRRSDSFSIHRRESLLQNLNRVLLRMTVGVRTDENS